MGSSREGDVDNFKLVSVPDFLFELIGCAFLLRAEAESRLGGRIFLGSLRLLTMCPSLGAAGRDLRPGGAGTFLLVRQRNVTQKKGDPKSATPALRAGAPCGARCSGVSRELALGSNSTRPLSACRCAPRRSPTGWGTGTSIRAIAALGPDLRALRRVRPSAAMARVAVRLLGYRAPVPSVCAEARRAGRTRAACCLSAKREFMRTPPRPSTAGCPSAKRWGRRQRGRPFFGDFLSATRKKVTAPPGAHPGQPPPAKRRSDRFKAKLKKIATSAYPASTRGQKHLKPSNAAAPVFTPPQTPAPAQSAPPAPAPARTRPGWHAGARPRCAFSGRCSAQ